MIMSALLFMTAVYARVLRRKVLWDAHACESQYHFRYFKRSGSLMALVRAFVWYGLETLSAIASTRIIAVSDVDRAMWARRYPWAQARLFVLETAVDASVREHGNGTEPPIKVRDREFVVAVGNFEAKHNRQAAVWAINSDEFRSVLRRYSVSCILVGRQSEEFTTPDGCVRGIGPVADVVPYLARARAGLAPLPDANGLSTKVIDYLRFGRAVIATPAALGGFEFPPGLPVVSCGLGQFAPAVSRLLGHPEDPVQSANMRRWASDRFSMERFICGTRRLLELL